MANHQQKHSRSKPAVVLGNGVSRLKANLNELKTHFITYGCNALYREYSPDYLVAVDVKMINEIISSGYQNQNEVWTNPNKGITSTAGINLFDPHKGWSSGPTALWLACQNGHKEIYILGFDYAGVEGKFNNVYADTFNYKKSTEIPTFFGNWANQTAQIISGFKEIAFYRVVDKGYMTPDPLQGSFHNFFNIPYSEFENRFPGSTFI